MLVATSFAAGLNVYATVLTLGVLGRYGVVTLPLSLRPLQSWWVIGTAAALFLVEFIGDKIPAFDLLWNALHTFIRVPIAALLSYLASDQLSPEMRLFCTILGGLIALAAHGGKTALRTVVTASPEPLSNIAISTGEDAFSIALTWLATKHAYAAGAIAICAVVIVLLLVRMVIRSLRALFRGAERVLENYPAGCVL